MNKSSVFCSYAVGAALLAMGATASAQNAKVGFVDVGRLLEDSPQAVAARQKLQNEFAPRNDELEKLHKEVTDLAQDLAIRRNEELGNLQEEVNAVVAAIASEEGFDLILTQAVSLYASKRIDITERVLKKMNNP